MPDRAPDPKRTGTLTCRAYPGPLELGRRRRGTGTVFKREKREWVQIERQGRASSRFVTRAQSATWRFRSRRTPSRPSDGGEKEDGWPREPDPSSLAEAHLDNKCAGGHDDHGDISCGLSLRRA